MAILIAFGMGMFWPVLGTDVGARDRQAAAPKAGGYWKFVEPRGVPVERGPGIESFEATATEGKISVKARRGQPEPQTFAVECSWTWSSPRGLDTLVPGDVLTLSMTIADHSQYFRTYDGFDHGYAGGVGVIRVDMPNLAVGGVWDTAQDLLAVTAGYQKSDPREATAKVPSGTLWNGRMALKGTCPGGLFERIYEWMPGAVPPTSPKAPPLPPQAPPLPPMPAKPLCGEALTKYPEFAGKPPVMRMDYADLQKAFNDAIKKYVDKTNQRPYVDDNLMGTLPALEWLGSEGGALGVLGSPYSKLFVFVSNGDREKWGKKPPTKTTGMIPGTEVYYYNSLFEAAQKAGRKLSLSELIFMALEQRRGNMKEAMLLAHNTFRSLARNREGGPRIETGKVKVDLTATDRDYTLVNYAPEFLDESVVALIDPPPLGAAQSHGALYHLFGTAYFEMHARGSIGENSIANWMWDSRMDELNDNLARMRKILAEDPQLKQPGNASLYSRATNLFEQWYRTGVSPDDPWKFCYNVYGAQIGSWLYRERLRQRGLLPAPPLRPGVVPTILGDLPPSVTLSASPLNMRWSGSGRTMTLDQGSNNITGDFPVRVLPYYEPDTKTWGLVWSELSDRPYELTLEATQGGWAHITRMAGGGKGTFVYAIPLQPAEQFTLAMDPTRPDAPMQKAGGGTITPIRLGASAGATKSGGEATGAATAPTPSVNVARGKLASQSSLAYAAPADRAVDGRSDGDYTKGSVTHTDAEREAWWQVDLGASHPIDRVAVWNRTDCCAERLSKFYVLVSDVPFSSSRLQATLSQPGVSQYYVDGVAARPTQVPIARTGRYVRIQLAGTNYLSIAEIEVIGAATAGLAQPIVAIPGGVTGRGSGQAVAATAAATPGTSSTSPAGSVLALDEVTPGSLADWKERFDPATSNPRFGSEEVSSPFDRSTALRTWAKGNTLATCETKWIRRVYATGPQQTNGAVLEAFLVFTFDGTVYNLPSVKLELLDAGGAVLAGQVYFGEGIIGSFNRGRLPQTGHRELPSASGLQRFDLAQEFGTDRRFSAVAVWLMNYTCQGENSIVFDHLLLRTKGAASASSSPPASRPATPAAGGLAGTSDLAAAFGATLEAFDRDFKGRAIRVSGRFQQVQLTGNNPTVFVRVGDWQIVCAQAQSGTADPLARTGLAAPVWISGQMLRVEGNQLWLTPGCVMGTE